ncbi:RsbRD N-terminal domain-containing protein [Fundidesulfovibrio agrisoli]|uniref:RsbRD N-terminal domain-containing protein n=1 Tax=Fundidesulfovibrio agrisoli TaxID=2922717 RepID=UPI001FADC900|nr:RsbRD N-terminal domain-containing protein [Fundidesulfovibrio agrisoli]
MNTVETLLAANRESIVQRWQHLILDTYPPETAKLWKKSSDPYHNPVGARIRETAEAVVDYLASGGDKAALEPVLDRLDELVRVRAVQNFAPSQAAGFLFLLKKILREGFWQDFSEANAWDQLLAMETRIDGLALASLDLYAKCREKLHEIKYKDLERSQVQLLKRAQLIVGIGEGESAD